MLNEVPMRGAGVAMPPSDPLIYRFYELVMTNGPGAVLAEIVENPLPKERARTDFHRHPLYYPVRNHVIDFLVTRSKSFAREMRGRYDPREVPAVRPTTAEGTPMPLQRNTPAPDPSPQGGGEQKVVRLAGHGH